MYSVCRSSFYFYCFNLSISLYLFDFCRQISSVLETPLIFTPLSTTTTTASTHSITKSAVAHSSATVKSSMTNPTVVLDINHSFWAHLQSAQKGETKSSTTRNHLKVLAADLTVCDFPGSVWSVAAHAEVVHHMVRFVFFLLYL